MANIDNAAFTLSLDCEGLWGMADNQKVVLGGQINQATLVEAYDFIASTLAKNNLKATAAFVTCFSMRHPCLFEHLDILKAIAEFNPGWFRFILPAISKGIYDGWSGSRFCEQMRHAGHEIAWHGTTHQYLGDAVNAEAIQLELELTDLLFRELGQVPGSVIFPRNRIGQLDLLQRFGFKTYRKGWNASLNERISTIMGEFNFIDRGLCQRPVMSDGWYISPQGAFLNWPSGVRSLVPVALTVQRWKSLLNHAVKTGGYLHMWFHPHNLITAPAMVETFKQVMDYAGDLVRSGDLLSLTMEEANDYYKVGTLE